VSKPKRHIMHITRWSLLPHLNYMTVIKGKRLTDFYWQRRKFTFWSIIFIIWENLLFMALYYCNIFLILSIYTGMWCVLEELFDHFAHVEQRRKRLG